jgi:Acetyltransferase (GNAT) domain
MIANNHIRYIARNDIRADAWNSCVNSSPNELIYGYTEYLDHMAKNWDGLVLNEYEAVMPLTWNSKWSIKYLYQPPLTPQLGIFSASQITTELVTAFLNTIPQEYKFSEIFLNHNNSESRLSSRDNFILDLRNSYSEISGSFRQDLLKNLKRAVKHDFIYEEYPDLDGALELHQRQYRERTAHVKEPDYERFRNLCQALKKQGSIILRSVRLSNQELLSLALVLRSRTRLYLLESTTLEKGREVQANHFLLDALIREFAGQELIFDFVGSSIPGVAHFYKNFGATNEPFFFYYMNRLPWPLRLFK